LSALISGVLFPLLFPKFNLYFLAPVFLIPLLHFSNKADTGKKSFVTSWISGSVCYLLLLYWVYNVLYLNGAGYLGSVTGYIALSAYLGLYWGAFGLISHYAFRFNMRYKLIFLPAVWTLLEYLKTYFLTGFPWLLSGYALWKIKPLIQLAEYTGVYGLSFLVIFANTAVYLSIKRKHFKPLLPAAVVLIAVFLLGNSRIKAFNDGGEKITVSILQGSISQYKKWNAAYEKEILRTYKELHQKTVAQNKPELIVWPETALPAPLTGNPKINNYMTELAAGAGVYELVGSVEKVRGKYYNSAYIVSPEGEISSPYRKNHTTPFGEYIPFRKALSLFVGVVNDVGDFESGRRIKALKAGNFKVATAICYESIFPGLIRKFFDNGSDILVNITNDGWFLQTAGPYQHFIHSVIRAVENRTYVVRAANTGISAFISPVGEITAKTKLMETAALKSAAGKNSLTFYSKFGDVFIAVLVFILGIIIWKERKCLTKLKEN